MDGPVIFYSPDYYADIGDDHVFPIKKFELVRDVLVSEGTVAADSVLVPEEVSAADVLRVHTADYVDRLKRGDLTPSEIRLLGLPWSPALVRRSFLAVSGTISASIRAVEHGIGSNLAGGTHHAFPDRGEGFCVLNDVAIATRKMREEFGVKKVLVVDLDVHQGNGTAFCFAGDPDVFTFSLHGKKNYPLRKELSDLDIELEDGVEDEEYLATLFEALNRIVQHHPDLVYYLAGADPFEDDKLGRLSISKEGLKMRDSMVLEFARNSSAPLVTVMSGGYAKELQDTVDIHCNTIRAVASVYYGKSIGAANESAGAFRPNP